MKPTIGRTVHYILPDSVVATDREVPAVITRVWSDQCVNLNLFLDDDEKPVQNITSVLRDDDKETGTWHWPERE